MEGDSTKGDGIHQEIVVNGILCYMSTARHVMKRDDIIRVCLVFYEGDDILSGKDTV